MSILLSCLPVISLVIFCAFVAWIVPRRRKRKVAKKIEKYRRETNMRRIQGLSTEGDYTYYLTQSNIWGHKFHKVIFTEPEHMKLAREAENAAIEFDLPNPTMKKFEKLVQDALDEQEAEQKRAAQEHQDMLSVLERAVEAEKAGPMPANLKDVKSVIPIRSYMGEFNPSIQYLRGDIVHCGHFHFILRRSVFRENGEAFPVPGEGEDYWWTFGTASADSLDYLMNYVVAEKAGPIPENLEESPESHFECACDRCESQNFADRLSKAYDKYAGFRGSDYSDCDLTSMP